MGHSWLFFMEKVSYARFISSFVFRHFWRRSYQNQLSFSGKDSTADFFIFRHLGKTKMGWNGHKSRKVFQIIILNFISFCGKFMIVILRMETKPERIYNPLRQWGFRQCLPFSWTTLRGKHCRHPIAVMGVVDTFKQSERLWY